MSSPAEVIHQLLLDLDLGALSGDSGDWQIFIGFLPEEPEEAICVYDTAGIMDGRIMVTGEKIVHPGIQIRIRGTDYRRTFAKVQDIAISFDIQRRISVAVSSAGLYVVHNVSRTGDILPLGVEEKGSQRRYHFTINAIVTLEGDDLNLLSTEDGDYRILE